MFFGQATLQNIICNYTLHVTVLMTVWALSDVTFRAQTVFFAAGASYFLNHLIIWNLCWVVVGAALLVAPLTPWFIIPSRDIQRFAVIASSGTLGAILDPANGCCDTFYTVHGNICKMPWTPFQARQLFQEQMPRHRFGLMPAHGRRL